MSTTTGKTGVATRPVANKRPVHGPGRISFGSGEPSDSGETAIAFLPLLERLFGTMKPHRIAAVVALVLAVSTVVVSTLGPKILGVVTNLLLTGITSKNMPMGVTKEQAIEVTRSDGNDTLVEMLQRANLTPGRDIDFSAIGSVPMLVLVLYVTSAVATCVSNWLLIDTAQKSMRRMRSDVEAGLQHLPLSYFDGQPHGELFFHVANDIDNISQTLMRTLPQFINSLLMVFEVVIIMTWILWPPTLVMLVSIPLLMLTMLLIA